MAQHIFTWCLTPRPTPLLLPTVSKRGEAQDRQGQLQFCPPWSLEPSPASSRCPGSSFPALPLAGACVGGPGRGTGEVWCGAPTPLLSGRGASFPSQGWVGWGSAGGCKSRRPPRHSWGPGTACGLNPFHTCRPLPEPELLRVCDAGKWAQYCLLRDRERLTLPEARKGLGLVKPGCGWQGPWQEGCGLGCVSLLLGHH